MNKHIVITRVVWASFGPLLQALQEFIGSPVPRLWHRPGPPPMFAAPKVESKPTRKSAQGGARPRHCLSNVSLVVSQAPPAALKLATCRYMYGVICYMCQNWYCSPPQSAMCFNVTSIKVSQAWHHRSHEINFCVAAPNLGIPLLSNVTLELYLFLS